jgi:hypothetical protein
MAQRLAADCRHLRRTIDGSRADGPLVCLCDHPVRSGFDCVGPFLDEMPTDCGLWENGRAISPIAARAAAEAGRGTPRPRSLSQGAGP